MTADTALAALNFAFAAAADSSTLALHFGSGEPLLRFDLLSVIVQEATRRAACSGQTLHLELTTNGTLVTPRIAVFLRDHAFSVRVSCDGPPPIHDSNRPLRSGRPSYRAVEQGLRLLQEHLPQRLTVNSVIAAGTRLRDIWEWARDLKLQHLHVVKVGADPESSIRLRDQELAHFRDDLEHICQDLRSDLEAGSTPMDYQPLTKIVRRLVIPQPVTRFCGVAGSYLGVASTGEIYPCFRHLGVRNYRLGDIVTGVDDERRREFVRAEAADVDNRPICRTCWARYLCGGGCYADSTVYGPDRFAPQGQHCQFWRLEAEAALHLYRWALDTDPTYCLRLLGEDPESVVRAVALGLPDGINFIRRQNCS